MTHGSLFSGIGGFELGAKLSGIPTLWNCEIEPFQRMILKKHFPETKQYEDIKELRKPKYVDIISGGFPCQDISIANTYGAKGIKGKRSGLWHEMSRFIREVRPKYVLIENSPVLLVRGFEHVLCDLSKIGYDAEWQCLSAKNFGFNHRRERFFAIAYSGKIGCVCNTSIFRELQEIFPKRASKQNPLSSTFERFDGKSNYELVRMDDGFSKGLDKRRIESMGNAVIPEIAHYLFECIKHREEQLKLQEK